MTKRIILTGDLEVSMITVIPIMLLTEVEIEEEISTQATEVIAAVVRDHTMTDRTTIRKKTLGSSGVVNLLIKLKVVEMITVAVAKAIQAFSCPIFHLLTTKKIWRNYLEKSVSNHKKLSFCSMVMESLSVQAS